MPGTSANPAGRLAGVARGGDEDAHLPLLAALFQARRKQVRQDLQRHVLERARRPVPELEKRRGVIEPVHRRNGRVIKLAAVAAAVKRSSSASVNSLRNGRMIVTARCW